MSFLRVAIGFRFDSVEQRSIRRACGGEAQGHVDPAYARDFTLQIKGMRPFPLERRRHI
jgi:hypothetical protein